MRFAILRVCGLLVFWGVLIMACSKDDPKPLGAQTNAKLLAGDKGKSKGWKLRELNFQLGSTPTQTATLPGYFLDNIYTFTNNDAQDYEATEGASKFTASDPDLIEAGAWAFTLDGLILNINTDETYTPNGLFSSEIYVEVDTSNTVIGIYNGGYTPYSSFVVELDENNLVLEINVIRGSTQIKYTLTFTPA